MANPARMEKLLLDACNYIELYHVPKLNWRRSKKCWSSSGMCAYNYLTGETRITVTAGTGGHDHKLVLLHELAHAATQNGHSSEFWDMAWQLYRWAKLPIMETRRRERAYMKGAELAYMRSRKGTG